MSVFQDLILEATPCDKCHMNTCVTLNGYEAMGM
jgi:hypothetical protein